MPAPATRSLTRTPSARSFALGLAALALAMTVFAPVAGAQNYARTTALSVFGGYNVASDLFDDAYSTASLEMKNSFMWGGRLTAFTNEYSAVEFAYTRNGSDLAIQNYSGAVAGDFDAGRLNADQYDLNFLVSQPSPNPRLWPYFTLGFGWTVTHPEVNAEDPNTSEPIQVDGNSLFAFNFGIGTLVEMKPNLSLRLDARWRVTDTHITTSTGYYCDYWGYCWSYSSDWYNSGEFTAGLTYRLGR
jgi:Outer membrane protein beta-barrel domain